MKKVILTENSDSDSWLEPFKNVLEVIKNTFAQFLNVASTLVRLAITIDDKEVFEIIDKYYDRMKSINAKTAEVMNKIEQSSGDMNLFTFLYNPSAAVGTRILAGGPGALRNFIDFYKDATGVSLNPFDIGPPGAKDSTSLMNNRMNYAMGFNYSSARGGGAGTAAARMGKQLEARLNRAFGLTLGPAGRPGARPSPGVGPRTPFGTPGPTESFAGSGLPILVEATSIEKSIGVPLTDAEFKKAVKHFLGQVDFAKLGVKASSEKITNDMNKLADELSIKLVRPYNLIMRLSAVQDPKEMYEILNEMKAEGFVVQGAESLRPDKIQSLVDETIDKAQQDEKVDELIKMSSVKPKNAIEPTEDEIELAAKEVVSKTVMSRSVTESKKQIEAALIKSKEDILKKFDETFLPKNSEDVKMLMKTKFGTDFKSARSKLESSGIPIQNQVKLNTI